MINGVHALIYSKHADAVRAFFRDTLGWGRVTSIVAAEGTELGLYQPKRATALHLSGTIPRTT